jgi:hypothetical protein
MVSEKESSSLLKTLLFPNIFRTFRMAIQPTKLLIAFLALAIICIAGWIMDFAGTVVTIPGPQGQISELEIYMTNPDQVESYIKQYKQEGDHRGVFSTLWHFAAERFHNALSSLFAFDLPAVAANTADCFKAIGWVLKYHFIYCIVFVLISLAVISAAGGSLCRMAALQFARGEKPGLTEALQFGMKKFPSFFATPLAPIGIIIFIGLFVFFLGLIGNIPRIGELLMAVFMPLALTAGILIAIILIGTVVGFNLMFPSVAYDGADCFDAISRSFSYVYSKPWRMGFYSAIAVVYGAICYVFVRFFAFLLLWATRWFLHLGVWVDSSSKQCNKLTAIWPEPNFMNLLGSMDSAAANWTESVAAFLIHLLILAVIGLLVAFMMSFYFSANTIIYSLMRNRVDNTSLEDVYTHFDDAQTEPGTAETESEESQPESKAKTKPDSSDATQ